MKDILPSCQHLPQREVAAGETVIDEGGDSGEMLILVDGAVEVLKGDVQVAVVEDAGAFFGEMAVLLGRPHSATVKALDPSRFLVIADPDAFLHEHPEVALTLAQLLARRLHAMTTYLADIRRQFADQSGNLGIIDEVLETLAHDQGSTGSLVSDRDPDIDVD